MMNYDSSPNFLGATHEESSSFTRRDGLTMLFKHRWLILGVWLLVTALAVWGLKKLPPTYVSEAKLLIQTDQQGRPSPLSGIAAYREGQDIDSSIRKLETEMGLLLSRPLVEKTVQKLDVQYAQVYKPAYLHLLALVQPLSDWIVAQIWGPQPHDVRRFDETVNALMSSITIKPALSRSGEATPNLVVLTILTSDPALADQALTSLISNYQEFTTNLDQQGSARVSEIIRSRVVLATAQVRSAQQDLERLSSTGQPSSKMAADVVPRSGLPRDVRRDARSESPAPEETQLFAPQESVESLLRRRLTQLELDLLEQEQRLGPNNDTIITLNSNIAQVRARLNSEVQRSARQGGEFMSRQRALRLAETNLDELQRKLTQIDIFLQTNTQQASSRVLIEPPRRPKSSEWRKAVIYGIAISAGGLALAVLLAAMREYADHRLTRETDIERYIGLQTLLTVNVLEPSQLSQICGLSKAPQRHLGAPRSEPGALNSALEGPPGAPDGDRRTQGPRRIQALPGAAEAPTGA